VRAPSQVGLISIAIALPVTLFIASCFAIANDSEAPEARAAARSLAALRFAPC
jgi:hypothetical protein